MTRSVLLRRAAALAGLLALTGAPGGAQDQPTFPTGVELVTVDVVVLNKAGNPVPGLVKGDFTVYEDGKPRPVSSFEAVSVADAEETPPAARRPAVSTNTTPPAPATRTFVVVFDNVHISQLRVELAKRAVRQFLDDGLRPGDQVTIVPTGGGAWWTARIPEGRADLNVFLDHLKPLRLNTVGEREITDWEATQIHLHRDPRVSAEVDRRLNETGAVAEEARTRSNVDSLNELNLREGHTMLNILATDTYNRVAAREKVTLGTLTRVAESLRTVRGRKALVLVSEGFVYDSQMDGFRGVVAAARESNAAIYFVDARGLGTFAPGGAATEGRALDEKDYDFSLDASLRETQGAVSISLDTGGEAMGNTNDIAGSLRRIAGESRTYYLVGFEPTGTRKDGKFHKIKVEVNRPDVKVRARKGYYAPGDDDRVKPDDDTLDPAVRHALDSPFGSAEIPLRLASYVLGPVEEGKTKVLLVGEANPAAFNFTKAGDRMEAGLDSAALVASRDTGLNYHEEKAIDLSLPEGVRRQLLVTWLPVVREFSLPPGAYQARLMVRDRQTGKAGVVVHELDVPASGFRTSTPLLTDLLKQVAGGQAQPAPVARHTFAAGGRLYCQYEVYGAATDAAGQAHVVAGFALRRTDTGEPVLNQAAQPVAASPGGAIGQVLALPLNSARPGPHELVLTVRDVVTGQTVESEVPFDVVEAPRAQSGS